MLRELLARFAGAGASAEAHAARFQAHYAKGELAPAADALEAALRLRPDWTDARYNLGAVLAGLGRLAEAEDAYRRVLAAEPDRLLAYRLLGSVLHRQGRVEELLRVLAAARTRHPADFDLESFELLAQLFGERLSAPELFERHRDFGRRLEAAIPPLPPAPRPDRARRLRIGYVSGDFSTHPVAQFVLPLLEHHDRAAVEATCYSVGTRKDAATRALAAAAEHWRDAAALSEDRLAEAIRADGIDVLVDLSGHSGIARLRTFARQPARVQVAWLGYLHSTGLTRMQYRITDSHADPQAAERLHTEKLVRLAHSQWCYRPAHGAIAPGARRDAFTFGAFNQVAKVSPSSLRLWAGILRGAPAARLLLLGVPAGAAREGLLRSFVEAGIAPGRLECLPHLPLEDYFRRLAGVDVALDTTPYSGGTTTFDALWMEIPVVTLEGERSSSRSAAAILKTLGLGDWVANSPEDYVAIALRAAKNRGVPGGLRQRLRASALMDGAAFAREFEETCRRLAYS